jgi:hypothetical protein
LAQPLGVARKTIRPDAWLQGHACWHVLTAVSLVCVYRCHRNERTER